MGLSISSCLAMFKYASTSCLNPRFFSLLFFLAKIFFPLTSVCLSFFYFFFPTEDVSFCLTNVSLPACRVLWSSLLSPLGLCTTGWKQYVVVLCINGVEQKELFIPLPVVFLVLLWHHKGTSHPFVMTVITMTLLLSQSSPSSYPCRNLTEVRSCSN